MLGPAFVAAVAYVDPGNFATNFSGGAAFGYTLLWVIVAANLMAMLIQSLTAKLGLATGRDLATLCRENLPRRGPALTGDLDRQQGGGPGRVSRRGVGVPAPPVGGGVVGGHGTPGSSGSGPNGWRDLATWAASSVRPLIPSFE